MLQDQTPRSLLRSFQNTGPEEPKLPPRNQSAKDSIRGFIQSSTPSQAHERLINSPQLRKFNVSIEDQVIRLAPANQQTPQDKGNEYSSSASARKSSDVSAFPPIYSAANAPPIGRSPYTASVPPPTPATQIKQEGTPQNPKIFTPVMKSATPQSVAPTPQNVAATSQPQPQPQAAPATTPVEAVPRTPTTNSKFIPYPSPSVAPVTPSAAEASISTAQKAHDGASFTHDDSTYKAITPGSEGSPVSNLSDASFEKLLSSPSMRGMDMRVVDQVLQMGTPADVNKSHASRSLFELSPTPTRAGRESISKSLLLSPEVSKPETASASKTDGIHSTPARGSAPADLRTPQSSQPLRPMVIHSTPQSSGSRDTNTRGSLEKQSSGREKNLAELLSKEKEKATRASPRFSPAAAAAAAATATASPSSPSKGRRDLRRVANLSRIESIQVKGTPRFAMVDYCLIFFNLIVFFAILVTLTVLGQVMSAVHQHNVEDMVHWTVSQLTNVQLGEMLWAFGQKYLPYI
eukprot:gene5552-3963_t